MPEDMFVKEEEKKPETEEKRPDEEKVEEDDKISKLLKNTRELLAELNETVNQFATALQSVDKKIEKQNEAIIKLAEVVEKKLVTVEEVSAKRQAERYPGKKDFVDPAPKAGGERLDITDKDIANLQTTEFLHKEAETPRPVAGEGVTELDAIIEKIYRGEGSLSDIAKAEKLIRMSMRR